MRRRAPSHNLHQCVYERSLLDSSPPQYTIFRKNFLMCAFSHGSQSFLFRDFSFLSKKKDSRKRKSATKCEVIELVYKSLNLAAVLQRADELDSRNCNYKLHIFAQVRV